MLKTQIVDVSRSAIIIDPEAFYENLMSTGQEDSPERLMPIVAYEGYNFLPTMYGYRSYFNATTKLNIATLPARCDTIINFQLSDYSNLLVALTETGIYTNAGDTGGLAWVQDVAMSAPGTGQYKAWSYTVIENKLYIYRQGNSTVHVKSNTPGSSIVSSTPSFLNMSGQMGIFRANGRLGFWDSANSISWSSVFNVLDFTPAIETLAGDAIFNDVLGRIICVKSSGSGFVIYSTRNIVGASYSTDGSILFAARTIAETAGIWSSKQVCTGVKDTEHYAYTNTGIKHITSAEKVEEVFTPVYDFLRESREPVYLDFLQGRYLFINVIDPDYIDGKVTFKQEDVLEYHIRFKLNNGEAITLPAILDGDSLEDELKSKHDSGITDGLYAEWTASGSKMVPDRIPSPLQPYELDDPLTPVDDFPYAGNTDPLYSQVEIANIRDTGVWFNKATVHDGTPFALALGYHDAPLGTGVTDVGLSRIKDRQISEWEEYKQLIADFKWDLAGATDQTIEHTHIFGSSYYPPSTNVDSGWVTIGTIIDPNPATSPQTEEFTGQGSYGAEYWLKRTYNNVFEVQRKVITLTEWPRDVIGCKIARYILGDPTDYYCDAPSVIYASDPYNIEGYTPGYDSSLPNIWVTDSNAIIQTKWTAVKNYLSEVFPPPTQITFLDANGNPPLTLSVIGNVITETNSMSPEPGSGYLTHGDLIILKYTITYITALTGTGENSTDWTESHSIDLSTTKLAYKRIRETKSLRLGATAATTPTVSTLYAQQDVLDWGSYTTGAPPDGFDWATNEKTIGSDIPFVLDPSLPKLAGITYPGATFLLQDASPAAIFPTFVGSLVYDTSLQKWGKSKVSFCATMDYSPINSNNNGSISYTNFGLDGGVLAPNGYLYLFSSECVDSKLRYGKFAMSRQGFTSLEYIDIKFRSPFTGTITLDTSLDGRSIHASLTQTSSFVGVGLVTMTPNYSGRWFIITVIGEFDLRSIEFTGRPAGIR